MHHSVTHTTPQQATSEHDTIMEEHNFKYALLQSEMEEARGLMEEVRAWAVCSGEIVSFQISLLPGLSVYYSDSRICSRTGF